MYCGVFTSTFSGGQLINVIFFIRKTFNIRLPSTLIWTESTGVTWQCRYCGRISVYNDDIDISCSGRQKASQVQSNSSTLMVTDALLLSELILDCDMNNVDSLVASSVDATVWVLHLCSTKFSIAVAIAIVAVFISSCMIPTYKYTCNTVLYLTEHHRLTLLH